MTKAKAVVAVGGAPLEDDLVLSITRSLVAQSESPVCVKNLDSGFLMVNSAFARASGLSEADLLGTTDALIDTGQAEARRVSDVQARTGSCRLEEWFEGTGTRRFYDTEKFPLFDTLGNVYAICSISVDVTEQRQAAAMAVESRDAALADAAAKSTFLATMSHEIRTPMNAVIGMTELLLDTDLDAQQREFVDTVHSSGNALLAVINDVLDFSKIESGHLQLEWAPFDLRVELEGCLDLVAAAATEKGLELICYVDDSCPRLVVGDSVRLRQMVINLLSNAVKFTAQGEIVLTVSAALEEADRLRLTATVRDTGKGMSADTIERLFQSFSQGDVSITRTYGGTGLGLAISQRLAGAMGGQVTVDSEPGKGSTFTIDVLLRQSDQTSTAPAAPDRPLAGVTVLVVEDNATTLHLLELQLTALGAFCVGTPSPVEALTRATEGLSYDLAILDLRLPEMDGMALARSLRALPGAAGIPLMIMTKAGFRPAGAEQLFTASLVKPVKTTALHDALALALNGTSHNETFPNRAGHDRLSERPENSVRVPAGQSLHVLLAEDNATNQRVAQLMLRKLGHHVDTVDNGQVALRAVRAKPYDVVLMDVQMPVMNGLEATRQLRQSGQHLQIIALTANALLEDREACDEAGMDGFITKPVRIADLEAALTKLSPGGATPNAVQNTRQHRHPRTVRNPTTHNATVTTPPLENPPLNTAELERLMEQVDGNPEMLDELIDTYLTEGAELVARLGDAAEHADETAIASIVHSLRSSSALIGAHRLVDLLEQTQHLAGTSPQTLPASVAPIEAEFSRVEQSLAAFRTRTPVTDTY